MPFVNKNKQKQIENENLYEALKEYLLSNPSDSRKTNLLNTKTAHFSISSNGFDQNNNFISIEKFKKFHKTKPI